MKPTLLIDGDLILYRSCIAVEKEKVWDEHTHVLHSDPHEAWTAITYELKKLFDRFETKEHVIALTSSPVFRVGLYPGYKSNRAGQRKPLCYWTTHKWLHERYNVASFPGLEADDVLGIFATREPNSILCSADKDMKTIPCTLWNGKEVREITKPQADYWHMVQTLTGDTTDGYPGCKGIGPKKAEAILGVPLGALEEVDIVKVYWPSVVAAYEAASLTEADAITQARLARILRDSDWNREKKEPILWTPPKP